MAEDTPPPQRARHQGDDHAATIDMLVDETRATRREMRNGFEAMQTRLAKGDTAIALIEERQGNQGTAIASLTKRFDGLESMTRALACDECEDRIERLERWRADLAAVEEEDEERSTWQPPWWLMLLLTIVAGVATAALTARFGGVP